MSKNANINQSMKFLKIFIVLLGVSILASCATNKSGGIAYEKALSPTGNGSKKLDVYEPCKPKGNPVVIFIHGGYWESGSKGLYRIFGRNLARKDLVTVIPNYTLSPDGNYDEMANDVAAAILWTYENIEAYNGNPDQIFLMGHSAGGHLISLVSTNPKYLESTTIIKGIILNDSAGLDMYTYLKQNPPTEDHNYDVTWTKEEANWKDASPIYFLSEDTPPFLIYVGEKSYPSIISQNQDFVQILNRYQPGVEINYLKKKHVAMMSQFFWPWNKNFDKILSFIDTHKLD